MQHAASLPCERSVLPRASISHRRRSAASAMGGEGWSLEGGGGVPYEGYPMEGYGMGRNMPLVGGAWPPLCYAVTCRASICRRNACVCDPSRCGASRMSGVTRRHRRQCMPGRMCYAVWPVGGVCPRLSSASTGECASAACVRVCEHASDCRVSAEVWHTPSPWERASDSLRKLRLIKVDKPDHFTTLGGLQTTLPTATDGGPRWVPIGSVWGPQGSERVKKGAHRVGRGVLTHTLTKFPVSGARSIILP